MARSSLKWQLKSLRHRKSISEEELAEMLQRLEGHDRNVYNHALQDVYNVLPDADYIEIDSLKEILTEMKIKYKYKND